MELASTRHSSLVTRHSEILLIHLGGLGDVCLSESTFLSLCRHLPKPPVAVGNKRFLGLFASCFSMVSSVEGREWLYLFSAVGPPVHWRQIILIGKDRDGAFRQRIRGLSVEPLLFIDMYPDDRPIHVEEYQLAQLHSRGVKPIKKEVEERKNSRLVLYPETEYRKRKWPVDSFIDLYNRLRGEGEEVILLEPLDLTLPIKEKLRFEELSDLTLFLQQGGIFVSNDSGVAHLAAACGMGTVTLFYNNDPRIWHPRGRSTPIVWKEPLPIGRLVEAIKGLRESFSRTALPEGE